MTSRRRLPSLRALRALALSAVTLPSVSPSTPCWGSSCYAQTCYYQCTDQCEMWGCTDCACGSVGYNGIGTYTTQLSCEQANCPQIPSSVPTATPSFSPTNPTE